MIGYKEKCKASNQWRCTVVKAPVTARLGTMAALMAVPLPSLLLNLSKNPKFDGTKENKVKNLTFVGFVV